MKPLLFVLLGAVLCQLGNTYGPSMLEETLATVGYTHTVGIVEAHPAPPDLSLEPPISPKEGVFDGFDSSRPRRD